MTSKERLSRLFSGKDIDRVPVWMLFPVNPTPFAVDVKTIPSYGTVIDTIYGKTDFIERRLLHSGFCINAHEAISIRNVRLDENGKQIHKEIICSKDVILEKSIVKKGDRLEIKPLISDVDELEKILGMPYKMPEPDVSVFQKEREALGDLGIMAIMLPDALSVFHDLCDETDFILMCYSETNKVMQFLDVIHERAMQYCKNILEKDICDLYWISGAEFVVPPMISPEYFDRLVVRYQKQLVDLVRSYGKKTMIHSHGKIQKVLGGFKAMNPDSLHPIEAPPMGDCTLSQAREALGSKMILAGNIQYGDLWDKTQEEIEAMTRATVEEGKKNPFILAMTASPTMPEINDQVAKNYHQIVETALKFGAY